MKNLISKAWGALKSPVMKTIDSVQAKWPPNRVVVLLTPLVFLPLSVWIPGWAATHFPGLPPLTSGEVLAVELSGALAALVLAYKFIDGWQKHEERLPVAPKKPAGKSTTATVHVHVADEKQLTKAVEKAVVSAGAKAAK